MPQGHTRTRPYVTALISKARRSRTCLRSLMDEYHDRLYHESSSTYETVKRNTRRI